MISAPDLNELLVLAAFALTGAVGVLIALRHPWWSVVATIVSLPLVPFWVGQAVGGFFVPMQLALALIATFAVLRVRAEPLTLNLADWLLATVVGIATVAFLARILNLPHVYALGQWVVFYVFGRVTAATYGLRRLATFLCGASAVVAAAMLVETVTGFNPWVRFARMDNSLYQVWSSLQFRGGTLRAEGSFGHSIAAGSSLAVAAVLVLTAKFREAVRIALVVLFFAAILATLSRIGMVTAAIGVGLAIVLGRTDLATRTKAVVMGLLGAGALAFVFVLSDVFAESGSEAANSAAYRTWLLELVPTANMLGMADSFTRSTAGGTSFGAYRSIDSALLLWALTHGWISTFLFAVLLLGAVVQVIRLRGGPASVAVAAQIPALLSVAFITQYAFLFWLVLGWATTESSRVDVRAPIPTHRPRRAHRPPTTPYPTSEETLQCSNTRT